MRQPFPLVEPFNSGLIDVGSGHKVYFEECGKKDGVPYLLIHGMGSASSPKNRTYFNTAEVRMITFHQRAMGKSTCENPIAANTTWDLVSDIEQIRKHLQIEKWHVSGGSWGSTLAMAYAQSYPERVLSLILRGIYFGTHAEDAWIYNFGANQIYPDKFEILYQYCRENNIEVATQSFYDVINGADKEKAYALAKQISDYEGSMLKLIPDVADVAPRLADEAFRGMQVMMHYMINECFFQPEQLLNGIKKIRHIPTAIIHGRYDVVCSLNNAWKLHKAWPEAEFVIVPDAGHHHSDPGNRDQLMNFAEKFSKVQS